MKNQVKAFIIAITIISFFMSCSSKYKTSTMVKSKAQDSVEVYTNSCPDVTGNILSSLKSEDELIQKEDAAYIMIDNLYHEKVYFEKSFEEREIKIYTFGKDSYEDKIAILGSMHGDEPQGKYIIEQLLEYIKENPQIIGNNQIMLIPCSNPDGLSKNKRGNANNVDLNRNLPTENWGIEYQDKNSRYYPGASANSEPETKILIKYIEEFKPKIIINIHSPLKVINYDGFDSEDIAKYMAKYNNYKTSADIGYSTPGSFGTYFGKERNIPVITLETGEDELEKAWSENKESLIEVILKLNKF